jgi:SAM-dependent methyltransferase
VPKRSLGLRPGESQQEHGWDSSATVAGADLPPDAWFRGYFVAARGAPDGAWRRDFGELRQRDIALFELGTVSGQRILDVACGAGLYLVTLAKMGGVVFGQDLSEEYISQAKQALVNHSLKAGLVVGDATRLQFEDNFFDAVVSGDFVEHISSEQKAAFFGEVFRVLRPGGVFVVKTPNLAYLRLSIWLKRFAALAKGHSPFGIHIEHTRGNPDNEHHGLATFATLRQLLLDQRFHTPHFVRQPLAKRPLPRVFQDALPQLPGVGLWFNRDVILKCRKPIFLGYFP